ncbi:hypothetical protein L2E82_05437 [Cichorium intybus]|uniref:Uncharacterized protein n=1 Tax=Cichorium intybus TaxID=13427 RepID=A0ACB9H9G9_CICIN|nr:hypothetical protein L2E82_05437 [Cichorium intybus]
MLNKGSEVGGIWRDEEAVIPKPHTVPCKVTGKCGSVTVRLVPTPRGAGIVAARFPKKVPQMAGIDDVFTSSRASTKILENFVKATFDCLLKTYRFLTPDFWRERQYSVDLHSRSILICLQSPPPRRLPMLKILLLILLLENHSESMFYL